MRLGKYSSVSNQFVVLIKLILFNFDVKFGSYSHFSKLRSLPLFFWKKIKRHLSSKLLRFDSVLHGVFWRSWDQTLAIPTKWAKKSVIWNILQGHIRHFGILHAQIRSSAAAVTSKYLNRQIKFPLWSKGWEINPS